MVRETKRMKNEGMHVARLRADHNRAERALAEAWDRENDREIGDDLLAHILGDGVTAADVSDRDRQVAATVVQWLGSPVGGSFLRSLGYDRR